MAFVLGWAIICCAIGWAIDKLFAKLGIWQGL
jgi:hypothetical protein